MMQEIEPPRQAPAPGQPTPPLELPIGSRPPLELPTGSGPLRGALKDPGSPSRGERVRFHQLGEPSPPPSPRARESMRVYNHEELSLAVQKQTDSQGFLASASSALSTWTTSLAHMCNFTACCSSGHEHTESSHNADTHAELTVNHVSFKEPPRQPGDTAPIRGPTTSLLSSRQANVGPRELPKLKPLPQLDKLGSMSQTQKANAKMTLHQEIKLFLERALYGEDCEVLNAATCQQAPARYVIDDRLAEITITPTNPRIEPIVCPLQKLNFVKHELDESCSHFTPAARSLLTTDLLSRLAIMEYGIDGETHVLAAFVLLPSSVERDHFAMCLNVLRHLAQQTHQPMLAKNQ